jgi:hypothetical protein
MADQNAKKANRNSYLKDLVLLFAVPIAVAIFAAVVIYIPRVWANPKYDFIYSVCDNYSCRDSYSVDATGYVTQNYLDSSKLDYYYRNVSLRYYDAADDSTRSITLGEARRYRLDRSSKSPDGYTLSREHSTSGFLFWGDYDEGWYLKNGAKKKKVELISGGSYYSGDVNFLGWINK